jgi:hypothetical protein
MWMDEWCGFGERGFVYSFIGGFGAQKYETPLGAHRAGFRFIPTAEPRQVRGHWRIIIPSETMI